MLVFWYFRTLFSSIDDSFDILFWSIIQKKYASARMIIYFFFFFEVSVENVGYYAERSSFLHS